MNTPAMRDSWPGETLTPGSGQGDEPALEVEREDVSAKVVQTQKAIGTGLGWQRMRQHRESDAMLPE
jgi:hypothetical protein